jgi:hypothetical protein
VVVVLLTNGGDFARLADLFAELLAESAGVRMPPPPSSWMA